MLYARDTPEPWVIPRPGRDGRGYFLGYPAPPGLWGLTEGGQTSMISWFGRGWPTTGAARRPGQKEGILTYANSDGYGQRLFGG